MKVFTDGNSPWQYVVTVTVTRQEIINTDLSAKTLVTDYVGRSV